MCSNSGLCVLAHIAQQVEHFLGKEEVTGSSPVMSSSTDVFVSRLGEGLCVF